MAVSVSVAVSLSMAVVSSVSTDGLATGFAFLDIFLDLVFFAVGIGGGCFRTYVSRYEFCATAVRNLASACLKLFVAFSSSGLATNMLRKVRPSFIIPARAR